MALLPPYQMCFGKQFTSTPGLHKKIIPIPLALLFSLKLPKLNSKWCPQLSSRTLTQSPSPVLYSL
jgi:hypothetical protein